MLKKRSVGENKFSGYNFFSRESLIWWIVVLLVILGIVFFSFRGITGNAILQDGGGRVWDTSVVLRGADVVGANPYYNFNFPSAVYLTGMRINWSDSGNGCTGLVQYYDVAGKNWVSFTGWLDVPNSFPTVTTSMTGIWNIKKESSQFRIKVNPACKKTIISKISAWFNYTTNSCFAYTYSAWTPAVCTSGAKQTRIETKTFSYCPSGIREITSKYCPVICTPTTCVAQGKNCGTISNGTCAGILNCGTCSVGQTCTNNVCVTIPTTSSAALIAKYSFDENSGSVLTDSSGKGNNGLVSGAVWSSGHRAYSLSFDGKDDYIQIPLNGFLPEKGAISMWINPITFGEHNYIFGETMSGWSNYIQLYFYKGTLNVGFSAQHTTNSLGNSVPLNKWSHVLLTWNKTNYSVYINKTLYSTGLNSLSGSLNSFADLGNNGESTYRLEAFNGAVDDVRIYNGALNDSEILKIYNEEFVSDDCTTNVQCSDGLFCNGAEVCSSGKCASGSVINCDDGNSATTDSCDEGLDTCTHTTTTSSCPDLPGVDYYVSSTHANRSDNNAGTDCKRPWANFDKIKSSWASIPAGATIHLERGSYWEWSGYDAYWYMRNGGGSADGGYVTIRGDDYGNSSSSKPILKRVGSDAHGTGAFNIETNYVIFRDFIVDGGHADRANLHTSGFGIGDSQSGVNKHVHHVQVLNMRLMNLGGGADGPGDKYTCGISIGGTDGADTISDILIEGNEISDYAAHGLREYTSANVYNTTWRRNYVHNNYPADQRWQGSVGMAVAYSTGGHDNVFEYNILEDTTTHYAGIVLFNRYGKNDTNPAKIRYNIIRNNAGAGIFVEGANLDDSTRASTGQEIVLADIYGNIIYGNRQEGIRVANDPGASFGASSRIKIFNNVFYNNALDRNKPWGSEINEIVVDKWDTNFEIENNIIVGTNTNPLMNIVSSRSMIRSNNLYWNTNGNSYNVVSGCSINNVKTCFESSAQNTNPNFVNVANAPTGFKVNSGSSAINNGANLGAAFSKAFDGVVRSGSWDIGVYEQ